MNTSPTRTLTDAQQRALDLTRHTAVSAGAGSGKTFVLTERFVRALERVRGEPRPLRRVVAITFSRKATAEMRARVRVATGERLRAAARAGDHELVRFWRHVREQLHTARITTIDAFCASLLREHPLAAGVDPGFEVVEAQEARLLAKDAVGLALTHVSKHGEPDDEALTALARLTARYRRYELSRMLESLLADRALADAWATTAARADDAIAREVERTRGVLSERFDDACARLRTAIGGRARAALATGAAFEGDDKLLAPVKAAHAFLTAIERGTAGEEAFLAAAAELLREKRDTGTWEARGYGRTGRQGFWGGKNGIAEMRATVAVFTRRFEETLWWYAPFDAEMEREGLAAERDLATLYRRVDARYRSLVGEPRRLDFAGLILGAGKLVARPVAARRIAREIDHLLVDEFQDTSIAQWSVLERILLASASEEPPGAEPRITAFVVGDEKQAIYEFRGGRVEVFRRVVGRLAEWGGQHVVMDDNFRSLPNPIGVVNDVFDAVFTGGTAPPYEAAPQPLRAHRRLPPPGEDAGAPATEGVVELLLSDPGTVKDVDTLREIEADRIAAHVRELVDARAPIVCPVTGALRPVSWADVAVIVFYKRLYANLESAFAARAIPTRVLGGLGFYQSREALDTTAFLRALTDPRDEISLAAVLRSPFANLCDPALWALSRVPGDSLRAKLASAASAPPGDAFDAGAHARVATIHARLERWQKHLGRVPTSSLLDGATRECGYRAVAFAMPGGERRIAILERLLDVVRRFEARHGIRPVELTEWLVQQTEEVHDEGEAAESGRADGVTLMTIHRAKGTEYPIVVVPGLLDAGHGGDPLPFRATHDVDGARLGLKVPVDPGTYDPTATDMCRTSRFRLLDLALAERRRAEEKRVLYVAMTRARDRLVLSTRTPLSVGKDAAPSALNTQWTALDWLRTLDPLAEAMSGSTEDPVRLASSVVEVRAPITVTRPELAPDRRLLDVIGELERAAGDGADPAVASPVQRESLASRSRRTQQAEQTEQTEQSEEIEPIERNGPTEQGQMDLFGADAVDPHESHTPQAVRLLPDVGAAEDARVHAPVVLTATALAALATAPWRPRDPDDEDHDAGEDDGTDDGARSARATVDRARGTRDTGDAGARRSAGAELGRRVHTLLARATRAASATDILAAGGDAAAHASTFLESERGQEALAAERAYTEIAFVLPTPHGRIDGTIDRLYLAPDGAWTIADTKTSRLLPGADLARHAVMRGYDVQLLVYAAAAARLLELAPDARLRLVLFFTDPAHAGAREVVRELCASELPSRDALGEHVRLASDATREGARESTLEPPPARRIFDWNALAEVTR